MCLSKSFSIIIKKPKNKRKTRLAHNNIMGTSIEERSKEIDSREEYGHWEGDTVCGKGRSVKFVLTERKTRFEIVLYTKEKTQKEVIKCLDKIERKMGNKNFREVFKSITLDNGCENLDYEGMERSLYTKAKRTKIYYTHPYSAYERGSNENANKLIRRFIPKGADIKDYAKDAPKIIRWMNNYPRKILGAKNIADDGRRIGKTRRDPLKRMTLLVAFPGKFLISENQLTYVGQYTIIIRRLNLLLWLSR